MSILDRLFRRDPRPHAPTEDQQAWFKALASNAGRGFQFMENREKIPINQFTGDESYLKAGSLNVWAAFRACHIVASTLLKVPTYVKDSKGNKVEPAATKGLAALMSHPNEWDSWEEMIYQWVYHMKLCGKAYWLKDQMDKGGRPHALYPLLPHCVNPVPDSKKKIGAFQYRVNGREREFRPEEIIHFRRPHPMDNIRGLGDVEPSEGIFNEHINRNTLNEKFVENGAQPSGVLVKEDAIDDPSEWEKMKSWWNSLYTGKKNVGKTAFLNGKWTYQQLGLSSQAQEALERERYTTESIFQTMGVPLSIAGVKNAANYATSKQDDINFRRYECVPLWDIFIGRMNAPATTGLARAFNEAFRMDYEIDGLVDMGQVAKDYEIAVKNGAATPNEMRVAMGLPKSDNPLLDQFFLNGIPVELAGFSKSVDAGIGKIIGAASTQRL